MKVLLLGVPPFPLEAIVTKDGHSVITCSEPIDVEYLEKNSIDFAVSYRYPHIIRKPVIDFLQGRVINMHISLLPWNRGADPNLWSFLENTPKGVTLHYVDEGLDTGDIIAQKEIIFDSPEETLVSSYETLNREMVALFEKQWPLLASSQVPRQEQPNGGNGHRVKDKERFSHLLAAKGWNTPVRELIGKGLAQD